MLGRCCCSSVASSSHASTLSVSLVRGPLQRRIRQALPSQRQFSVLQPTPSRSGKVAEGGSTRRQYSNGRFFNPRRPDFLPTVKVRSVDTIRSEAIDAGSALNHEHSWIETGGAIPASEDKVRRRYLSSNKIYLPAWKDVDTSLVATHQALVHGDVEAAWRAFEAMHIGKEADAKIHLNPMLFDALFWSLFGQDLERTDSDTLARHCEYDRRASILLSAADKGGVKLTKLQRHRSVYIHVTACERLLQRKRVHANENESKAEAKRLLMAERQKVIARDSPTIRPFFETVESALFSRIVRELSVEDRLEQIINLIEKRSTTHSAQNLSERQEKWVGKNSAHKWLDSDDEGEIDQHAWFRLLQAASARLLRLHRLRKKSTEGDKASIDFETMATKALRAGELALLNLSVGECDHSAVQFFFNLLDNKQLSALLPDSLGVTPNFHHQLAPAEAKRESRSTLVSEAVRLSLPSSKREELQHFVALSLTRRRRLDAAEAMLRRRLQGKLLPSFSDEQGDVFAVSMISYARKAENLSANGQFPRAMKHVLSALRFFFQTDWHHATEGADVYEAASLLPKVLRNLHKRAPGLLPDERWMVLLRQLSTTILTIDPTFLTFTPEAKKFSSGIRGEKGLSIQDPPPAITLLRFHLAFKDYAFAKRFFLIAEEQQQSLEPFLTFEELLFLFKGSMEEEQTDFAFTMLLHTYMASDSHWSTFTIPNDVINTLAYRITTQGQRPEFARYLRESFQWRADETSYSTGKMKVTAVLRFVETFARACSASEDVLLIDELLDFVQEAHDLLSERSEQQIKVAIPLFSRAMQLATQIAPGWNAARRAKVLSLFERFRCEMQEPLKNSNTEVRPVVRSKRQDGLRYIYHAACRATIDAPAMRKLYDLGKEGILFSAADTKVPFSAKVEAILTEMRTKWQVDIDVESYDLMILSLLVDYKQGVSIAASSTAASAKEQDEEEDEKKQQKRIEEDEGNQLDRALLLATQAIRKSARGAGTKEASDSYEENVGSKSWARRNILSVHTVARLVLYLAKDARYEDAHYLVDLYISQTPLMRRKRLLRLASAATLAREGKLIEMKQVLQDLRGRDNNLALDETWKASLYLWAKEGEEERKYHRLHLQQQQENDNASDEGAQGDVQAQQEGEQEAERERAKTFAAMASGQALNK